MLGVLTYLFYLLSKPNIPFLLLTRAHTALVIFLRLSCFKLVAINALRKNRLRCKSTAFFLIAQIIRMQKLFFANIQYLIDKF